MLALNVASLAVPAVLVLIAFLALSSQLLFSAIDPAPLTRGEIFRFNALVLCILVCYARACLTNPGFAHLQSLDASDQLPLESPTSGRRRWCRKCASPKPPRAHHCKICKRCVPKMDHHCPWTVNCVSHRTFPHFIRFLFYAVAAMTYLEWFLFVRCMMLWEQRNMPSYHGPSAAQLVLFLVLVSLNSLTLFALAILLIRTAWCLVVNTTTIEGWEIERHETLLRRARALGGYLTGPNGEEIRMVRQEFPYDVGFWKNIVQGMGSRNVIAWFYPFAASPSPTSGLLFETNGFEDPSVSWPPPDPDRIPVYRNHRDHGNAFTHSEAGLNQEMEIEAFRARQREDFKRWDGNNALQRRVPFYNRNHTPGQSQLDLSDSDEQSPIGEEGWRNSEGERLEDFGLDEETEFYDEENAPLAMLLANRRRKMIAETQDDQ